MLVDLNTVLRHAEQTESAVGAFNAPNLASLHAILRAAEEKNVPVILMHAQVHEEMGLVTMDEIAPILLRAAERSAVPVCVHLDHGTDPDYVRRGIRLGFTSVMFDGSELPEKENVLTTAQMVREAHAAGVSVEAEIGSLGAREGGTPSDQEALYTDPEQARAFASATGIDALACAFGTAHGLYREAPRLDFNRVSAIRAKTGLPLVMHGGSGVSDEGFRKAIACGIRKINYYTYMTKAGADRIAADCPGMYHDIELQASEAMKQNVLHAMNVFSGR